MKDLSGESVYYSKDWWLVVSGCTSVPVRASHQGVEATRETSRALRRVQMFNAKTRDNAMTQRTTIDEGCYESRAFFTS